MAQGNVDSTNMVSQPRENIKELIKNNVSDPTISSSGYRKWIYNRDPDVKSLDFKGYPYIIIRPATANFGDEQTGNAQIQSVLWGIEIDVITSDRGNNNRDGKGQEDNDSISDDVIKTLNSETGRSTLRASGMRFIRPNVAGMVVEEDNQTLIFRRSFLVGSASKKKVY